MRQAEAELAAQAHEVAELKRLNAALTAGASAPRAASAAHRRRWLTLTRAAPAPRRRAELRSLTNAQTAEQMAAATAKLEAEVSTFDHAETGCVVLDRRG